MSSPLSSQTATVIGGGSVGTALADHLSKSGVVSKVIIAARDVAKTKAKLEALGKSHLMVQDILSGVAAGSILILATTGINCDDGLKELVESLGDVSNKTIIDTTNPFKKVIDGVEARWEQGTSAAEYIQSILPNTKVYKAFNTVHVDFMIDGTGKDLLYAGPDKDIAPIVEMTGLRPIYVGPIRNARNLEAMGELWVNCAVFNPHLLGKDWAFGISGSIEE